MKQDKRLTRAHKILLTKEGLDPNQYRLVMDLPHSIIVRHCKTGETEIVEKG